MAGDTGMARKVALLLWAQTLGLAGAQTTQLLVDPPWKPAVLWDQVTLSCQGLGTAGATTWYQDGQHWWQEGPANFTVTASGTYTCDRPSTGLSPPMRVLNARLVLQVPAWELLEGDTVTLRCRCWRDMLVTEVRFYHEDKEVGRSLTGTKLSLSPLQLNHSGRYRCGGWVSSNMSAWMLSAPVTVTVHVPVDIATITPGVLELTPRDTGTHRDTVAAGVSGAFLFLLLLVGIIVAWYQWHRLDARKHQERPPLDPLALPVEDPHMMYMELQRQPWEPSDTYDNLHQKL
ncbi:low affinity immunoglobulin gamma Fc region receptor III-like isoform X2 [Melospiza melodia melodia]|uniref:low affinity immunoglobulin gamma Fc region receptor III-like isoform X2 n=1 Tax=Melospiza melodia melodia TaxID=1914991 RepID=UPI002FD2C94C